MKRNPTKGELVRVTRKRVVRTGPRTVDVFSRGDVVIVYSTDAGMVRVQREPGGPIRYLRVVDVERVDVPA